MSTTRQSWIPGHPQPTPESIERDDKIREAFLGLGKALAPVLEYLPSGSQTLTIVKRIEGFHYKLSLERLQEK